MRAVAILAQFVFSVYSFTDTTVVYFQSADTLLKAQLYRPDSKTTCPAIVALYEGGFVRGDHFCFEGWAREFAGRGFALMSPDYRKMQEQGGYPRTVRDALHALEWLQVNGRGLGIDSTKIFLMGSSAGAYLAAMAAVRKGLLKERPMEFAGFRTGLAPVRGTILSYGIYDWQKSRWKGEGFVTKNMERIASPVNYAAQAEGVFLIFAGSKDRLFGDGQARAFAATLEKTGRKVELIIRSEGDHEGICQAEGELARFEKPAIFRYLEDLK